MKASRAARGDASLVDPRREPTWPLVDDGAQPVDEASRDLAMRCADECDHVGVCELDGDLARWALAQPTGGFVRCSRGDRFVFVPPETCRGRVEQDDVLAILD